MISRTFRPLRAAMSRLAVVLIPIVALGVIGCEKVPLLAPTGSTITLTSATTALPINGTATIVAQLLESSGTPPHSGTRVNFTTTLGTIEPAEASTDVGGRATVTFRAGPASGTAIIAAFSGGATTSGSTGGTTGGSGGTGGGTTTGDRSLKIAVGAAAVSRINVSANPTSLPASGGNTTVTAYVIDINGNPLASAPVTFTTTAGTLSLVTVSSDANGVASTVLTTFQTATVTANVGASTGGGSTGGGGTGGTGGGTQTGSNSQGSVTVTLLGKPTVSIAVVGTSLPTAGLPTSFTLKVTPAAAGGGGSGGGSTGGTVAISSVTIDWNDGSPTQRLGAISGDQTVSHVFSRPGTYTVRVTATDVAGESADVSVPISVIETPQPAISITYSPVPAKVNTATTINVQVTVPPGLSIVSSTINFGDNTSAGLGGGNSVSIQHVYTTQGVFTVSVSVVDSAGKTTVGFNSVSVGP